LLQDGFSVGDSDLAGPFDTASSQGGDAALERDAGAVAGRAQPGGSAGWAGTGGAAAQAIGGDAGDVCPECETCNACGCAWGPFGAPEKLTGLGFAATSEQWGPTLSADALTLMLSNTSSGGSEDLYVATRPDRSAEFSLAAELAGLDTTAEEGTPFLSFDALSLYFFSTKTGGLGNRDIYVSKRASLLGSFDSSSPVGGANSSSSDHMPWLPADELSLYFASSRPGGAGGYDLWFGTRTDRGASFGSLRPLTELDTSSNDQDASLTADELSIFFTSGRPGGTGGSDIYMAERASKTGSFSDPVIVPGINTPQDELNVAITADGRELFFSSDRGTASKHVIWRASRSCE
jgi:hypothetical protein